MYATIEPRLIALLNDGPSEPLNAYPRLDLPPLDHSILKPSNRISPLESSANIRNEKQSSVLAQQTGKLNKDVTESTTPQCVGEKGGLQAQSLHDRALGSSSPQSLRKILDSVTAGPQLLTSRRRQRTESNKDEFVQLPQPPKKQKATTQVVPPIIIGLFEPPPNAALFPPIASSSFHDSHGRNSLNTAPPNESKTLVASEARYRDIDRPTSDIKEERKSTLKARKKWTETETTQLLLGVQAHGVGNWTKILQDPAFHFDGRRAVDLKDRFRTCCPMELRGKVAQTSMSANQDESGILIDMQKGKPSLDLENDHNNSDSSVTDHKIYTPSGKSRAHRKKLEDLAELGIKEPFKRSRRRERRPFSEEEDRAILQGFQEFGPAWTRILNDPRFNLKTRRPTDLRDRLRNKYPDRYSLIEDNQKDIKEASNSVNKSENATTSSHNFTLPSLPHDLSMTKSSSQQALTGPIFKDHFLDLLGPSSVTDSADPLSFDWNDNVTSFPNNMGEMDISRILLDDTWSQRRFN